MKFIFLLFLSLLFGVTGFASGPPIFLEAGKDLYELGKNLEVLEDPTGQLTIEDVSGSSALKFKRNKKNVLSFGFTSSTIWIKLPLKNSSSDKDWILAIPFPDLDSITFFKKGEDKKWIRSLAGDTLSSETWEMRYKDYIFHLKGLEEGLYFLKVKSLGPLTIPIHIKSPSQFKRSKELDDLFFGGFLAILITMFFYNLMIGFVLKSLGFFYYVAYILFCAILSLIISGVGRYQFIDSSYFSNQGIMISVILLFIFLLLFTQKFLDVEKKFPENNIIFIGNLKFLVAYLFIAPFIPLGLNFHLMTIFCILTLFGILYTGFYLFKTERTARFFIYSFFLICVGGILKGLSATGIIPSNSITEQGIYVASIIQLILLSLGLADQFINLKESVLKKEKELKYIQKNYAKELESDVLKKTAKIDWSNKMLEIEKICTEELIENQHKQKMDLENILNNLEQGYLVFNREGLIQEGATRITDDLLETNLFDTGLECITIWDVLFSTQSEKDHFKKWVKRVFEGRYLFKDLRELAPKKFRGTKGKYVRLEFRPIYENGSKSKIEKIILIASDKSEEFVLEKKLEKDKEEAKFMTSCLQSPVEFIDLIEDSYELLNLYPRLKEKSGESTFRSFHTLKARFAQFGIISLASLIHDVETAIESKIVKDIDSYVELFDHELQEFIKKHRLIIEATNKLLVDEGSAIQASDVVQRIIESKSLEDLHMNIYNNFILVNLKDKFKRYRTLVEEMATLQGKSIECDFSGDKVMVEYNKYAEFVNVSIHLFRNMVDHGIETEDVRIEKTKSRKGKISIEFKKNDETFFIHLKDDGGGIDPEKIKDKVIEKGLKNESDLENLMDSDFINMIFLPGFSTKEIVTDVSGRGIGMNAVREEVENLGGKITVSSKLDEGTTFVIKLPLLR